MRLLLTLRARRDCRLRGYNRGVRGRIWSALEDTAYSDQHDDDHAPSPFSFSEIFPPDREVSEGDEKHLMIASPFVNVLEAVVDDLTANPVLNCKELSFDVLDGTGIDTTPGDVGAAGVIQTASGVSMAIGTDSSRYWGFPDDRDIGTFRRRLGEHVRFRCRQYGIDEPGEGFDPFDEYELVKTYRYHVAVAEDFTAKMSLSKWRFGYVVRDEHHRRILDLLLDTGIGEKVGYGLGFMNRRFDVPAGRQTADETGNGDVGRVAPGVVADG